MSTGFEETLPSAVFSGGRSSSSKNQVLITKSIKMTPDLSKKIKLYAAMNDIFESDLVAKAVELYLAGKKFTLPM